MWQEQLQAFLATELFGNTLQLYLLSAGIFLAVFIGIWAVKALLLTRLARLAQRTATALDDFLVGQLQRVGPMVSALIALYLATRSLLLAKSLDQLLHLGLVVLLTIKVVQLLQAVAGYSLRQWTARLGPEDPMSATVIDNVNKIVRVVLWLLGLVFILDNLGINVTSVVAGLGIGGVAVALAAQAVLGDAFSSFAIFIDKPFKVGDFIIVGDLLGSVEHIGFKTTRIRSLHGEQLIFANSDLTNSRVRNYKRMETRRIAFQIGVTYQTTTAQVKAIPVLLRQIVEEQPQAKFDRAHFHQYGDFALIFEIVFYVLSPDYNVYMDVQQAINVRIKEAFERQGIEFAYPTQQLYLTRAEPAAAARP